MEEFELEPGEKVILEVRKHWLVFVGHLLPFAFLAWVPTAVTPILTIVARMSNGMVPQHIPLSIPEPFGHLVLGLWWLILWIGAFNAFSQYFLNVWVITSFRIVTIHQRGFFDRQVSSFLLSRVQDITTTVDSFFGELFGFGSVRAETAGNESKHFVMQGITNPQNIRDLIMREIAALKGSGT